MRRTNRRGVSGRWFPTAQTTQGVVVTGNSTTLSTLNFQPIIADGLDEPANEQNITSSLGLLGAALTNSYLIKRILGSIFVGATRDTDGLGLTGCIAAAAIFVERVDAEGQILNAAAWDPLDDDSAQKSWMWRRVWRLGRHNSGPGADFTFPDSNALYGSIREGTHVDVKSKRNVGYEERLWLCSAVRIFPGESLVGVTFSSNLRLFGRMQQRT